MDKGKNVAGTSATGAGVGSTRQSRPTTTISTIAIKSGEKTRMTLAVLKSTDWVVLRVDEMEPSMLDVGKNLREATALQAQHKELLDKLEAKHSSVQELLSKADQMVSEQEEPQAAVYEAMANSLGEAWKDLNRQLQLRATLLEQAVQFFTWLQKHEDQLDGMELYFENLPPADNVDVVKQIIKRHGQMRLEILDSAVQVMTFGQTTIEKLREIGSLVDNIERLRETADACAGIEDHMLGIHDRRKKLEIFWEDKKAQLDWSQQSIEVLDELTAVEAWLNRNGDALARQTELGESEMEADMLLRQHEQLFNSGKKMQENANRLLPMAEQLVTMGYEDGGLLLQRCTNVRRQYEELLQLAELRRQLLLAAVAFFRAADAALNRLDQLDLEIHSLNETRGTDELARRHAELASEVEETAQSALAQGRALLQRVGRDEPGARGVAQKFSELEKRAAVLDQLCTAHKAEALARSRKYQDFLQHYSQLHSWLVEKAESAIYTYRDMGTTLPTVSEFLERHRQLATEITHKESEVTRFIYEARDLENQVSGDDYEDLKRKRDDIRTRWDRLKKAIDTRIELSNSYHQFHRQATQHSSELDTLEAIIRTNREVVTESTERHFEEMWSSLNRSYDQLKSQGEKFLLQSRVVINDQNLDIRSAQTCVERLVESVEERQQTVRQMWNDWRQKLAKDRQFQDSWNHFTTDCRRSIHYVSQLQNDSSVAFTHFEHPPAVVAERQQRALEDFLPKARKAQREIEHLLRTAETLGAQGETRGEKERMVDELLRTHQQFQQTVTQFEVLTSMTITFFRNLHQIDEWIGRVQEKFQPEHLPRQDVGRMEQLVQEHQAATQTVEQLLRFARNEGQQIVQRARQPDVAPQIRQECEKITNLVDERTTTWEQVWTEQHQQLQQHSSVAKFEKDIVEIFETVETLRRQVQDMTGGLGTSPQSARNVIREFREVERKVNITDSRVRSVTNTIETLLSGPFRGNQTLKKRSEELTERWTEFRRDLDQFRQKLAAATTYWTLVEESETWIRETTEYMTDVSRKVTEAKTSEEVGRLMDTVDRYMKPKETEQENRLKEMEEQAKVLYDEEADHKMQNHKKKYKEIVDSFVLIGDRLSSLQETYRTEEIRQEEIRQKQLAAPPPVPPRFVQTLKETEVTEGETIEMTCQVTGYPEPETKWFKDNVPIADNPDYETKQSHGVCTMKIEETFTEDSAVYTCRASNEAGVTDTSARLSVKESPLLHMRPPEFTKKLESETVEETTTHIFECHVTGTPTPTVSWYKNDKCIDSSPDYRTSFNNGVCRVRIDETVIEDEARYTCRASNAAGEAATSAKLTVQPKIRMEPPIFVTPLPNVTVQTGEEIVLETIIRGTPTPTVHWRINNRTVEETTEVKTYFDGTRSSIVVRNAKPEQAGAYVVTAKNAAGEATSTGFVTVIPRPVTRTTEHVTEEYYESKSGDFGQDQWAPSFVRPLQDQRLPIGSRARLDAVIVGSPRPKVTWLFNGQPITTSTSTRQIVEIGETHSIIIPQVGPEHLGTYTVITENTKGTAQSTATLGVDSRPSSRASPFPTPAKPSVAVAPKPHVEPPHFSQTLVSTVATEGEEARFEGVVTGVPMPEVTWYKDGKELNDPTVRTVCQNGKVTLIVPRVGHEHTGKYTCSAKNDGGLATSSAQLVVGVRKEAPDFIQRLISKEVQEGTALRWEVRVSGDPTPKVTWLRNNVPIQACADVQVISEGRGVHVLYVPQVVTADTGQFTCKAENDAGEARSTADLVVRGKDQPPRVYYHVTRVYQQNHELGMESSRFHSGVLPSDDESQRKGTGSNRSSVL